MQRLRGHRQEDGGNQDSVASLSDNPDVPMNGLTPGQLLVLATGLPILIASLVAWMTDRGSRSDPPGPEAESEASSAPESTGRRLRPMADGGAADAFPHRARDEQKASG
jgi:hypothetical protein